ncbi:MAG: type II toxin-antitoxin system VapC family toxin [Verrucomicrobia bacterium]|nr:type II toxin-antitoxin system VapC family toxin [Verrucomicrobiota bacterium]
MILLDTNVVSELMRREPSAQVVAWIEERPRSRLGITAITQAEILYGIELLPKGRRKYALLASAQTMFSEDFRGRIYSFNSDAAYAFAKISAIRQTQGKPISQLDAQIAAIVQTVGAELATRNVTDFEGCGIKVLNPWY